MTNRKITKLTDWKNEPTYDDLHGDYLLAKADHADYVARLDGYKLDLAGGKPIKAGANKSTARPLLIRKTNEWRYPAMEEPLLNTTDMFEVRPRTFEDAEPARRNALLLNYQWSVKVDKVSLVNRLVRNFEDEGTAIIKTGWTVTEGIELVDEEQPVYGSPEESMMLIQQAVESGQMPPEQAQAMVDNGQPMQTGTKIVQVEKTVLLENSPIYEVCDNESVIIDPTCGDTLSDAKFVIHEYEIDKSELVKEQYTEEKDGEGNLVKSGIYHNIENIEDMGDDGEYEEVTDGYGVTTPFIFNDKARKKLRAYEYWGEWDINGDDVLVAIVATWVNNVLVRLEENPFPHGKIPFSVAANIPVKNSVRGEPVGTLLAEQQKQVGIYTRAINDMMSANAVGQTFINDQLLSNRTEKDNYAAGRTTYFRNGMDPKRDIHKTQLNSIDPVAMQLIQANNTEAEALSGTKAFSGGISGSALGSTATGVRSAMDATAKREISSLRRISNQLLADIGRKTIAMNQVYLSEEETIRITNMEHTTIRREDIQGEFDLIVDVSTPEKDNETANDLAMVLQTGASVMQPDMVNKVWAKILRLKGQPDLAQDFLDAKPPEPSPEQVKMQEIQMQTALLEQEKAKMEVVLMGKQIENYDTNIAEKESRIKENHGDQQEALANAELKKAQAEKLRSETDMLDKQYLDGDTEVEDNHQRELEKMHTQALYKGDRNVK